MLNLLMGVWFLLITSNDDKNCIIRIIICHTYIKSIRILMNIDIYVRWMEKTELYCVQKIDIKNNQSYPGSFGRSTNIFLMFLQNKNKKHKNNSE